MSTAAQDENQRLATVLASVLASVGILAGIALVTGFVWARVSLAEKREWLRENGVVVTASVTEFEDGGSRGTDVISIAYEYEGTRHEARIPCAGGTGCHGAPPSTLEVRVDPRHPDEFLAENGHTDDSSSPRGAWPILIFGLVLLVGGSGLGGMVLANRVRAKRRSQRR